jgi:serine/threonine protein phosphatase 1
MIRRFARMLRRPGTRGPRFDAPLVIDRPTYAVGDVHGRHDLLEELLGLIRNDAAAEGYVRPRVVFMGDYVDRGDEAARVVGEVRGVIEGTPEAVALRGNHEEMLLDFLREPDLNGPLWLRNGGLQTLMSYGVGGLSSTSDPAALTDAARRLAEAMGPDLPFLHALPTHAVFGKVLFAHAGADPELPVEMQSEQALLWGAPRFRREPRWDGLWVVHGHYITEDPAPEMGRIPTDTGAYFSNRLTAARLAEGEIAYLST